jgi:hypothetical protein
VTFQRLRPVTVDDLDARRDERPGHLQSDHARQAVTPGAGCVHEQRCRQLVAVVQRHTLYTTAADAYPDHTTPESHIDTGISAGLDEVVHGSHGIDVPAIDLEQVATAAFAIVSLAGLQVGRKRAGTQCREPFGDAGVVQDF